MELRLPSETEFEFAYRRDLIPSFPESELAPYGSMLRLSREGVYRPWCLFDGGELLGEAFVLSHPKGFALLDYLCTTPERRGGGLGARLLEKLAEAEGDNVICWESEIPAYAPDKSMAERRLAFYRRCGARAAGYDCCEFGVPYHTLYLSRRPVEDRWLAEAHAAAYRRRMPAEIYEKYILIPWDASLGIPEQAPWWREDDEDTGL